jgi:predicted NBD/HSP70 family sugar kinase
MTAVQNTREPGVAIGVDVGGTKCAAGLVELSTGRLLARRLEPTGAERGGAAVLADVIDAAKALQRRADELAAPCRGIGVGVAELVGVDGQVLSDATIKWSGLPVAAELTAATGLPARLDADVRAAARAEARFGAGRTFEAFVYVTVGTGISCALVIDGEPFVGARGLTGTFASAPATFPTLDGRLTTGPPLEQFAAGPALSARLRALRPEFAGGGPEVLALAASGDQAARAIVASAGETLGAALAQLINIVDPAAIVLGGGLGLTTGLYREAFTEAVRRNVWSPLHRQTPLVSAELGVDAGVIGASLAVLPYLAAQPSLP